jgi:hypothetical protein
MEVRTDSGSSVRIFLRLGTDAVAGSEPVSFDWPVTICFIAAHMVFRRFRRMHNFL